MWKYSETNLLCNKFDFEVPLEDLYPSNCLHPKIKMMYDEALKSFENNNVSLDMLLINEIEGPEGRIQLKEDLLKNKHTKLEGTSTSFMWLIEHFLGLLPIPLLASYINGYHFNWLRLSRECKDIFYSDHSKRILNFDECDRHINYEIAKLPQQYRLLLNEHIEFMRNISFIDGKKRKKSVVHYSKFFTASLLIRPFRSGLNDKLEKDYYHLIIYVALRWPHIKNILVESPLRTKMDIRNLENSSIYSQTVSKQNNFEKNFETNSKFCSSFQATDISNSEKQVFKTATQILKISEKLSSICLSNASKSKKKPPFQLCSASQVKVYSSMHLSSVANNTLNLDNERKEIENQNHGIINRRISKNIEKDFVSSVANNTLNSDNERKEIENQNPGIINTRISKNIEKDFVNALIVTSKENLRINQKENMNSQNSSEGEDIKEEHELKREIAVVSQDKEESVKNNESDEESIKVNVLSHSKNYNSEMININSNILKRISKVGWTYTPPKNNGRSLSNSSPSGKISDDESTHQDLIEDSQNKCPTKRYPEIKSLKSRLSFLKIKKRNEGKALETNFKYTKINS